MDCGVDYGVDYGVDCGVDCDVDYGVDYGVDCDVYCDVDYGVDYGADCGLHNVATDFVKFLSRPTKTREEQFSRSGSRKKTYKNKRRAI